MKKMLIFIAVVMTLCAAPQGAKAACPQRMDHLDDFAQCMVPLRGTIGMATTVINANYDQDHRELLTAMMLNDGIPRQVMPVSALPTYPISPFYPYFAARYGGNPAIWFAYRPYLPIVY